jgi:hypothetical protein
LPANTNCVIFSPVIINNGVLITIPNTSTLLIIP